MSAPTAHKCKACGFVMYPSHLRCLHCGNRAFEQIEIPKEGRLITYTEIWNLPWGIDERSRVIGIAEFENGVKAMGLVRAEKLQPGMMLSTTWEPVRLVRGEQVYGLVLEPTE
jgi:uncharacterized OB-fold protein